MYLIYIIGETMTKRTFSAEFKLEAAQFVLAPNTPWSESPRVSNHF